MHRDPTASRRALLGGLAGAVCLSACSIRRETDAPDLPGIPSQGPPPDQELLLATAADWQALVTTGGLVPTSASPYVAGVLALERRQLRELRRVVGGLGIEQPSPTSSSATLPSVTASPTPTPAWSRHNGGSPSPTTPSARPGRSQALAWAQLQSSPSAEASAGRAAGAAAQNRPMLLSLHASRLACGQVLGHDNPPADSPWPRGASAVALLRAVRPAVYGLEQVAAQTPLDQRQQVGSTLHWLYGARSALESVAGASTPPDQSSYRMPTKVTDATSGRRLAQQLLLQVASAAGSQSSTATALQQGSVNGLLRLWSLAVADRWRWGAAPNLFPGLTAR